ncbi:MAG TPA: DUF86 domain-containing protein [Campylobacterales bacterium]|jgi:uncharacterized protein with HEPN domain|nr:DUF86 domain-containing protein [Nitratifractor sp.]HHD80708.1 DUF86 domain-containing protein [Campylobacterales bacterium]
MSDKQLMVLSTLEDIQFSIELIMKRFEKINSSDDFLADEDGLEKLDGISMRLVAIGEGFKNIDKLTDKKLLLNYSKVNWKGVKGVRDILSHHYFDLDAETIYMICNNHLEELLNTTKKMIIDVKCEEKNV